jgi:hypothetical protein
VGAHTWQQQGAHKGNAQSMGPPKMRTTLSVFPAELLPGHCTSTSLPAEPTAVTTGSSKVPVVGLKHRASKMLWYAEPLGGVTVPAQGSRSRRGALDWVAFRAYTTKVLALLVHTADLGLPPHQVLSGTRPAREDTPAGIVGGEVTLAFLALVEDPCHNRDHAHAARPWSLKEGTPPATPCNRKA